MNETRLDKQITDSIVNINGYSIARHDRNRDGGGVAIFYRNCINVALRNDLIPEDLEAICVEVMQAKSISYKDVLRAFSNPLEHLVTIGSSLLLPYHFKYIFKRRFFSELISLGRYLMSHQEMGPISCFQIFGGIGAE